MECLHSMSNGQFEVVPTTEKNKKSFPKKRSNKKSKTQPSTSDEGKTNEAYENNSQLTENEEERNLSTKVRTALSKSNPDKKREKALWHLITSARNWGRMSPMQLAMEVNNEEIITHPMCTEVVEIVWRKRDLNELVIRRHTVLKFKMFFKMCNMFAFIQSCTYACICINTGFNEPTFASAQCSEHYCISTLHFIRSLFSPSLLLARTE